MRDRLAGHLWTSGPPPVEYIETVLLRQGLAAPVPIDTMTLGRALTYLTCLEIEDKAAHARQEMNG